MTKSTTELKLEIALFTIVADELNVLLMPISDGKTNQNSTLLEANIQNVSQKNLDDVVNNAITLLTKNSSTYIEQVQTFGEQDDSANKWAVKVLYYALLQSNDQNLLMQGWRPIHQIEAFEIANNQKQSLQLAYQRLQNKALYTSLPLYLLGSEFSLSECQKAYECVLDFNLEKKSFRRRIMEAGLLEETGNIRKANYRPAQLYRRRVVNETYFFSRVLEGKRESITE